jgi:hypothetical protein
MFVEPTGTLELKDLLIQPGVIQDLLELPFTVKFGSMMHIVQELSACGSCGFPFGEVDFFLA